MPGYAAVIRLSHVANGSQFGGGLRSATHHLACTIARRVFVEHRGGLRFRLRSVSYGGQVANHPTSYGSLWNEAFFSPPSARAARGGEGSGLGFGRLIGWRFAERPPTPDPSPPLRGGREEAQVRTRRQQRSIFPPKARRPGRDDRQPRGTQSAEGVKSRPPARFGSSARGRS